MLRPTQDYIVVLPIERKQSEVLEVVSHEKQCRGKVMAVGPGKHIKNRLQPLDTRVGEIVGFGDGNFDFYPRYEENGIVYRIIQEADIVGIFEGEELAA